MKKKLMITVASVAVASVLGLGIYQSNAAQAEPKLTKEEIEELVYTQYPGTITEIDLDKGFNRAIYEVEVESNGKEYELKLDGNTGEVLKLEERKLTAKADNTSNLTITEKSNTNDDTDDKKDDTKVNDDKKDDKNTSKSSEDKNTKSDDTSKDNTTKPAQKDDKDDVKKEVKKDDKDDRTEKAKDTKKNQSKNVVISYDKAKKIALGEFAGTITEIELDEDDGRLKYEIEIESKAGEAELEIDAYTGEIIYISIENEYDDDDNDDDWDDNDD